MSTYLFRNPGVRGEPNINVLAIHRVSPFKILDRMIHPVVLMSPKRQFLS